MKKDEIIQAWRDGEYFDNLDEGKRRILPIHPAGLLEVDDAVLNGIAGGATRLCTTTTASTSALCTPCSPLQCAA